MVKLNPEFGKSSNNIPFAKFGKGSKSLLLFYGGPGNLLPEKNGFSFKQIVKDFIPLSDFYTITLLVRKIGLTNGYTTEMMAADYADMINQDFGGKVDAIIGYSYGGIIAQHFAADFPDICPKIIIMGATNECTPEGEEIDKEFAQYFSKGNIGKAYSVILPAVISSRIQLFLFRALMGVMGLFMKPPSYHEFAQDVMIELEAELNHDASEKFPRITNPVLILIGEKDKYFTVQSAIDMSRKIPNSILKIYKETGHDLASHPDFLRDITEFIEN
ncbi:MAG: alpha/beta fold hydrolase [Candidatus Hodarchaeales archaeon]